MELYLVTGAAGHLGNALMLALAREGKRVRALVLPGEAHPPVGDVEVCYGDVCDQDALERFFAVPVRTEVVVIHAAGIVSIASKHDQRVFDVNVGGTKNVVRLCIKHQVKKLVYVSSVHAIASNHGQYVLREADHFDPHDVHGLYARTKAAASQLVLNAAAKGLNASVVHPSGLMGPYDYGRGHLTAMIIDYMRGGLTCCIKGGYDFVDVRDVADGILACCEKGGAGGCYVLSNQFVQMIDVLKTLHCLTGHREIKRILPAWFVKGTAPLAEIYYKILRKPPLFTAYSIEVLENGDHFDHSKATRELGYQPRELEKTLRDTLIWLREQKRIKYMGPVAEMEYSMNEANL